jgi:hypothetical protein
VGHALWGAAIPVDPGSHVIEVTAPGKKPWQATAKVEGDKASVVITIPALEDAPATSQASAPTGEPVHADASVAGTTRRTLGLVVAGAGVVGLGVGAVFALKAKSNNDESFGHCDPIDKNSCNQDGVNLRDSARNAGTVATVAVGLGAIALAAGGILFFTAPSGEKPSAILVPSVAPGNAGLALVGRY